MNPRPAPPCLAEKYFQGIPGVVLEDDEEDNEDEGGLASKSCAAASLRAASLVLSKVPRIETGISPLDDDDDGGGAACWTGAYKRIRL